MQEVLVNRLGGLSLPRKSGVRLIDRPDMTLDVYRGCKTTMQQQPETRQTGEASFDTNFFRVDQKQCRNGEACLASPYVCSQA